MNSVETPAFDVVGLRVRTNNGDELSGDSGRIGHLWERFLGSPPGFIPNLADSQTIYSVYSNYASDETGDYDIVVGKAVVNPTSLPDGLAGVSIPAGRYLIFGVEGKQMPQAIQDTWRNIYNYFMQVGVPRRAFTVDYEKYGDDGVNIYIAVGE